MHLASLVCLSVKEIRRNTVEVRRHGHMANAFDFAISFMKHFWDAGLYLVDRGIFVMVLH
jgi:hypothetical protein